MAKLLVVPSQYELDTIWSMNEFLSLFFIGPNRLYLSDSESHSQVSGTEFGESKDMVMVVLVCSTEKLRQSLFRYIGSSKNSLCFLSNRHDWLKMGYRSQNKGLIDFNGFKNWTNW